MRQDREASERLTATRRQVAELGTKLWRLLETEDQPEVVELLVHDYQSVGWRKKRCVKTSSTRAAFQVGSCYTQLMDDAGGTATTYLMLISDGRIAKRSTWYGEVGESYELSQCCADAALSGLRVALRARSA